MSPDARLMSRELAEQVARSPGLFRNCIVLLDLETLGEGAGELDLPILVQAMREAGMLPVLVRGAAEGLAQKAAELGLGMVGEKASKPVETGGRHVTISRQPVRSGQKVYGMGGDLVVFGSVNPGAEVHADGSIHIYGALRGRALAGVLGDTRAGIFCQAFHAEFISIAGLYRTSDSFDQELEGRPAHISLEGERMVMLAMT